MKCLVRVARLAVCDLTWKHLQDGGLWEKRASEGSCLGVWTL